MSARRILTGAAAALLATTAVPSSALTITETDVGGAAANTLAGIDFRIAADYWQSQFKNDVTVNINIGFSQLPPNVLGSTSSTQYSAPVSVVEQQIKANANTTLAQKAAANLPTINANGAIAMITPGYVDPVAQTGVDTRAFIYDNDASANNKSIVGTAANFRALGFAIPTTTADATIKFSNQFTFDFNPSDGIAAGAINFLQVAIHEIGHALGFISGVDTYDVVGCPNGPSCANYKTTKIQNFAIGTTLDLYRYSANPTALTALDGTTLAAGPALDWSIRDGATSGAAFAQPYFSIDGGATALFGNLESRGQYNTNSYQASHWRSATIAGQPYLGIMDPVGNNDKDYAVTALDLAAFNAIGWDTVIDPLKNPTYTAFTGAIFAADPVPEPATWAMLLTGFAAIGVAARRRQRGFASA